MSLRAFILASLGFTFISSSFAEVILPAPRAYTQVPPVNATTTTTVTTPSTVITKRALVPGTRPMIIQQNNTVQTRTLTTPNPLTPTSTHPVVPNTIWQSPVPVHPIR